jgi:nucleotidyltransferase/DNA polymerase involved in DNA repair
MALCIWWPGFELQLERARAADLEGLPLALSDAGTGHRRFIEQACSIAAAEGVRPGIPVSQAIALCPSIVLLEQDPDFYDAARHRALEILHGWSPVVELSGDRGRLFVGVDGLDRLYGTPENQLADLRQRLGERFPPRLLVDVRFGYAPGKFAAWVAARAARPGGGTFVTRQRLATYLSQQPVDVLPVSPRMVQRLKRLGVERLDRLIEIPEPALVAQFGADGRRALAWATGARVDPVQPAEPERPIRVSLDFPAPIGQLELLYAALDRLLGKALKRSRTSGRSVRGVRVGARLEDGGSWAIRAILKDPTSRADTLGSFLRSRITLSPPTRAVEELKLEFFRFGPSTSQVDLFDPKGNAPRAHGSIETSEGEVLPELLRASSLLKLRLGEGLLYRVLELQPESRIPERRHALLELAS